ncbi:methylated-DNA--[protein]-cysteine S-methyltransferase [Pelagibius litoralis]|uniref:methylated-DNA--[protein]-cysteine S-methyltransferase n=1 Tax=Pelagibius litoralis TaxID=374515 RepID=A0A967EV39_9PROT|nr:methylated-DNA--[protein]-cysteine S-methyltransferase [Pelagibius litoralis]NIA68106.1 methylated-DNA--[protein]-cysteine S-methyltransferase [Pelagibius litoralis]
MDIERAKQAVNAKGGAGTRQIALVRDACAMIDRNEGERLTLAEIAEALAVSPWHLQRLFKRIMGVSPRDYGDARRGAAFREQLKQGESIAQATYGAGYGSSSRIYERAERLLGMTPASYAKGGKGADIAYDVVDSPLGRLLVAATAKGLCFLSLGSDDAALVAQLEQEFPKAERITRDRHSIAQSVAVVIAFLEGETPNADLPLDVQATAFQRRVWQELIAIPCGETRSYSEIAESLGVSKGQRAVGRACATNPVSLVIPCHRALRENGELGGYRWGLDRKAVLLTSEAERAE